MKESESNYKVIDGVTYDENGDAVFTVQNKADYTLLIPTMLPVHFTLIKSILKSFGYKAEILESKAQSIAETGLKYVHNDTCYPATLVIGQFIEALQSGDYDTRKVALVISQTGGGCRASNYLFLLKKALKKAGFGYIPVLSFNLSGLGRQPGFDLKFSQVLNLMKCVLYGDLIMLLKNQCEPYEVEKGATKKCVDFWSETLAREFLDKKNLRYSHIKKNYKKIVESFSQIKLNKEKAKVKVGIVGEIFVKYSPLANNELENFLLGEGAEVYVPGLTDFVLYSAWNNVIDGKLYGEKKGFALASKIVFKIILKAEKDLILAVEQNSDFEPMTLFSETIKLHKGYIGEGMKMGEGWLLTAEMVELIERGVNNIICAQPFGCLPNHIAGKGMMKILRERNPNANIVAIDYDASASKINQENRIKLMLANAKNEL